MIIINRWNEYRTTCTLNHKRRYKHSNALQNIHYYNIIIPCSTIINKWSKIGGQVKWWGNNERRLSGDWSPDETSVVTLFSLFDAVPAALFQLLLIWWLSTRTRFILSHPHVIYPFFQTIIIVSTWKHVWPSTVCLLLIISDDGMDVIILVYCIIVGCVVV